MRATQAKFRLAIIWTPRTFPEATTAMTSRFGDPCRTFHPEFRNMLSLIVLVLYITGGPGNRTAEIGPS